MRRKNTNPKYRFHVDQPSRWLVNVRAIMAKLDPAEVQPPTFMEVANLALEWACEEFPWLVKDRFIQTVFYWPRCGPPCKDIREGYMHHLKVQYYKHCAMREFRKHYTFHHALKMRCERWRRAHPTPRGWAWTRQPLKNPVPTPRKRIWRPPDIPDYPGVQSSHTTARPVAVNRVVIGALSGLSPPATAPPVWPPRSRPGWREQEALSRYPWLFDIRIVVPLRDSA